MFDVPVFSAVSFEVLLRRILLAYSIRYCSFVFPLTARSSPKFLELPDTSQNVSFQVLDLPSTQAEFDEK